MKTKNSNNISLRLFAALSVLAAVSASGAGYVNGARVDGAEPGEWTHDWDAATAKAKADGKPVFVNFAGSDWCGWCKLLKRQVFTQPEWGAWASNHVYLVHLDFPNDKELVPEKYRERNRELSRRYKVDGYPTCYLLDPATLEPLGRFGASRDANAADFVKKVSAAMADAKKAPAAASPSAAPRRPDAANPVFQIENGVLRGMRPNGEEETVVPAEARIVYIDRIRRVRRIVLSEGVEELRRGDWGYDPGDPLESFSIPKSVRTIQPGTFYGYNRNFQTIEIADGSPYTLRDGCLIDTRDSTLLYAFPGRERIVVPDGVKSIADHAFDGNRDLRKAVLPNGVESIGRSAFSGCRSLESVTIPATVSEIGDYAFSHCRHLSTIDVVAGNPRYSVSNGLLVDRNTKTIVRGIGGLRRVDVPTGTEAIATGAFSGMESLVSATVPDSVNSIGDSAFAHCPELVDLRLPKCVASCGGGIVRGCARLKSIKFPVGTKRISGQDLNGCDSLLELDVPEGVVSLDGWKTVSCRELARLSLPASLRATSGMAFGSIPKLGAIDVHPDNPSFRSEDGILFSKDMTRLIRCPETKKGVYAVPETVQRIDGYAFANCHALTEIRIPEGATSIGRDSFENCPAKTNRVSSSALEIHGSHADSIVSATFDLGGGVSLEMIHCPQISSDYWMGKYEITQEQWLRVMGTSPSSFKNKPKNPVENVSWVDCQAFVEKLNALPTLKSSGMVFRLPTRNEWETACLAGAPKVAYYCKLADGTQISPATLYMVARYDKDWDEGPAPVGSLLPNAWGLYDMHGNVWEWTQTEAGKNRVYCGGSFFLVDGNVNVSSSGGGNPVRRDGNIGFRIAAVGTGIAGIATPQASETPHRSVPAPAELADRFVDDIRTNGARPGEWTYDWNAATEAAKTDGKPIFAFFGPNWNGWCKLLKVRVFTKPEWKAWASNRVYLVHVKFQSQNSELLRRYNVEGYPTYLLVDSTTLEPLGRFGASRDVTASNFIEKVSAAMPSANRTVQGSTVTTNDFKAVLTGVAVVDDKDRHKTDEAAFVPPESKVVVPYGKTVLFRMEYDFPEGYGARVWTRDGICDDGRYHSGYFGSNPSGMFNGKGIAYGFLSLLDRGKACRVRELLLRTSAAPKLDNSPKEWTMATVPIDVEFLEKPRAADTEPPQDSLASAIGARVNGKEASAGLPINKFPHKGLVAGFTFSDEDKADDFVKKGRKFQVGGVPPRWNAFRPANDLVTNGALRVSGEYKWEALPHLDVPELRYDRFTVAMAFRPQAERGRSTPLVSFGGGWRWFHVLLRADGTPVVSFRGLERGEVSYPLPEKFIPDEWNWIAVAFDIAERRLSVVLNGRRCPDIALPPDFAFRFDRNDREKSRTVQFANTNNGSVFKGEINGFLLFDRAFTSEELDAIAVAPAMPSARWTFVPDKEGAALYWNGTVSNGAVMLDARLADGKAAVSLPETLSIPGGVLDLSTPIIDGNGAEVPLVGIGRDSDESHVGFGGVRRTASEIRLPATVRYIGPGAFERVLSLGRFDCPVSVRRIGSAAFDGCGNLRRFRVGPSVESFSDDRVFMGCEALEAIETDPANTHYKTVDGALLTADGKRLVAFPPGRKGPFAIPAGVEAVPARAFLRCKELTSVSVPASVKSIGIAAFADCPALEKIEFENRSFKLDDSVFGTSRKGETIKKPATNLLSE